MIRNSTADPTWAVGNRAPVIRICALVFALLAVASFSLAQLPWP